MYSRYMKVALLKPHDSMVAFMNLSAMKVAFMEPGGVAPNGSLRCARGCCPTPPAACGYPR
jgi:hypothetical protein